MNEEYVTTKTVLLAHIQRDWEALHNLLDSLSMAQMTNITNADGWSIKDHIAHMTAWEDSVIAFLTGKPRHEGIGISESLYLSEDLDAMNHAIFLAHHDKPLTEVQERFRITHSNLLSLLTALTDEDLNQRYSHYLPDEPGDGDGPPAINVVYGNTAHHYRTHQGWIEAMLSSTKED